MAIKASSPSNMLIQSTFKGSFAAGGALLVAGLYA